MSEQGWIKLHRKTLNNPIVMKDADHLAVWVYLLLKATRVVHNAIFDGKNVELKPGQLIIGRRRIGSDMGIHESKVQRILKCFESEHLFKQQTSNKSRLISILKWKEYQITEQDTEQQLNNKRTTTEQQANTIQEVLEVKKDKNVGNGEPFFEFFRRVAGNHITDEELMHEIAKFKNKYPNMHPNKSGALINTWVANIGKIQNPVETKPRIVV